MRRYRVTLLGEPKSGKTSIIRLLMGDQSNGNRLKVITNRGPYHLILSDDEHSIADGLLIVGDYISGVNVREMIRMGKYMKSTFILHKDDDRLIGSRLRTSGHVFHGTTILARETFVAPITDLLRKLTRDDELKVYLIGDGPPRYLST